MSEKIEAEDNNAQKGEDDFSSELAVINLTGHFEIFKKGE